MSFTSLCFVSEDLRPADKLFNKKLVPLEPAKLHVSDLKTGDVFEMYGATYIYGGSTSTWNSSKEQYVERHLAVYGDENSLGSLEIMDPSWPVTLSGSWKPSIEEFSDTEKVLASVVRKVA